MAVEVIAMPSSIFPDAQTLTPDRGPGQSMGESPHIGSQNVTTMRGAERWRLNLVYESLTGDDRADMMAFVTRLRISHNCFLAVNHTAPQRGVLSGSPTVAVSSLNGKYLVINTGLGTTVASWARAGDFVSVNSQLKMVLTDKGTVSGVASLEVWPPLYDVPALSTPVAVSSPCGGFRVTDVVEMTTNPPGYRTYLNITAVERINSAMVSDFL